MKVLLVLLIALSFTPIAGATPPPSMFDVQSSELDVRNLEKSLADLRLGLKDLILANKEIRDKAARESDDAKLAEDNEYEIATIEDQIAEISEDIADVKLKLTDAKKHEATAKTIKELTQKMDVKKLKIYKIKISLYDTKPIQKWINELKNPNFYGEMMRFDNEMLIKKNTEELSYKSKIFLELSKSPGIMALLKEYYSKLNKNPTMKSIQEGYVSRTQVTDPDQGCTEHRREN